MYITDIKVNYGRKSAILNLIKLIFFRAHPSLKPNILFYSDDLAVWHGFQDITHRPIKINMAESRPFRI